MNYSQFGIVFSCDFPLPELSERKDGKPVFRVSWGRAEDNLAEAFETRYEFHDRAGRRVCYTARKEHDHLLVFPGSVSFLFKSNEEICCLPEQGCEPELVRLLLVNQVIPRFLGSHGHLVVHASAVVSPQSGKVVAFLGNTGYGKSTLASALHREGAALVSDDGILLRPMREGVGVWGGPPAIRLLPDSFTKLFGDAGFAGVDVPRSAKRQVSLETSAEMAQDGQLLSAVFVLNDPVERPSGDAVRITPLAGADALMAMVHCLFNLDPSDPAGAARAFGVASEVFHQPLPVYSLAYPRNHERLPEVIDAIHRVTA